MAMVCLTPSSNGKPTNLILQAIFSSTASAFQFEPLMLSEAAIMAQGLGYNRGNGLHESAHRRTFWVLYFMEKVSCFITGKISVCITVSLCFFAHQIHLGLARLEHKLRHSRLQRLDF